MSIDKAIQCRLVDRVMEWALMYRAYSPDWWIAFRWDKKPTEEEVKEKRMLIERGMELGLRFSQNRLNSLPSIVMDYENEQSDSDEN